MIPPRRDAGDDGLAGDDDTADDGPATDRRVADSGQEPRARDMTDPPQYWAPLPMEAYGQGRASIR